MIIRYLTSKSHAKAIKNAIKIINRYGAVTYKQERHGRLSEKTCQIDRKGPCNLAALGYTDAASLVMRLDSAIGNTCHMQEQKLPAFVRYGIVPRSKTRQEPQFRYDIGRTMLPEIAALILSAAHDYPKNPALIKLGFTLQRIVDLTEVSDIKGKSFSVTDISPQYVKLTVNASLLRPMGIDLKASANRAVASFGLSCLTDYDRWQGKDNMPNVMQ